MNKYLKQLHISQNVNMVSGIKCNNCQRIQPTMPEYVFLNPNYRCVCLQEAEPLDTDFLVISPTQEEIKELDDMVMKEYKKRGAKPKNTFKHGRFVRLHQPFFVDIVYQKLNLFFGSYSFRLYVSSFTNFSNNKICFDLPGTT